MLCTTKNYVMKKLSLLVFAWLFILVACDKEPEPEINDITDVYQGQLIDVKTGEGVAGQALSMWHYLGGTAVLNVDSTETNASGNFTFEYLYNLDTLLAMSEMYQVDTQYIHNDIRLLTNDYVLINRYQNGSELVEQPIRLEFAPDLPILYEVHLAESLLLTMVDTSNTHLFDNVSIKFTTINDPELFSRGAGNPLGQSPEKELAMPVDEPILMRWVISEGILEYDLDSVATFMDTIQLTDGTPLEYVLFH